MELLLHNRLLCAKLVNDLMQVCLNFEYCPREVVANCVHLVTLTALRSAHAILESNDKTLKLMHGFECTILSSLKSFKIFVHKHNKQKYRTNVIICRFKAMATILGVLGFWGS